MYNCIFKINKQVIFLRVVLFCLFVLSSLQSIYAQSTRILFSIPSQNPIITNHPIDQIICENSTSNFTVAATSFSGSQPLTYQWQVSTNGGATFTNITNNSTYSGATTSALSITNVSISFNNYKYRVIVTNACNFSDTSNSANLIVNSFPIITGPTSACVGNTISLTGSGTPNSSMPWVSSNTAVATINSSGLVTALSSGITTITYINNSGCWANSTIIINSAPSLSFTTINTACNGDSTGAINLSVSGGATPYTYSWSNGQSTQNISNLVAGSYNVVVAGSDACNASTTATITQPTSIVISALVTNVSCYGLTDGQINTTINGGVIPYSFSWNNGSTSQNLNGLAVGNYALTVTDLNGCTMTSSSSVTQPNQITLDNSVSNTICSGATLNVNLTASNGVAPYFYSWVAQSNPNVNGESTSTFVSSLINDPLTNISNSPEFITYTVTVSDNNGCIITPTLGVNVNPSPTVNAGPTLSQICKGATTSAMGGYVGGSATGGTWSGGAGTWTNANDPTNAIYTCSLSDSDTITLTLTTNGGSCGIVSETKTLIVKSLPTVYLQGTSNSTCAGDNSGIISVNANGGLAPYLYSLNNGTFIGSNNFTGLVSGNYTITVKDTNNCISSITTTLTDTSLIEPAFSIPNSVCSGSSINLPTTSSNGITGSWNPPANSSVTTLYTFTPNAGQCADTTHKIVIINFLQLMASSSVTDCGNGNGFVRVDSVIGGTAPFIYQLSNDTITQSSPNFLGLQAGNYTVSVTDANFCTASANMNIGPVQPIIVGISGTNLLCAPLSNASLTANVNGGTAPYQFNWLSVGNTTPVLNGLSSGTYTVVIYDEYSCSAMQTITITEPDPIIISLSNQINVSCNGLDNGSATVNATGGSGALSYIWNTTPVQTGIQATNLFVGNYVVTVNDTNNCQATYDVIISEPTPFTASVTYVTNISCNGATSGSAAVAGVGGVPPCFYSWSTLPAITNDTAFNLTAGNYTVTVYDSNNCTSFANVSINAPNTIVADISSHTDVTCFGNSNGSATVVAIGGNGPLSYNWNTIPSQFGTIASNLPSGNYTVTVSDTIGCSDTAVVIVSQPQPLILSIISQTNALGFGQNNGTATVSASGGISPYSFSWSHNAQANSNFVADLPSGSHLIIVTDANACSDTSQINIGVDVSNLNPEYLNTRSNVSIQFNVFSNDQNMFGFVCDTISILQPNHGTAQISSTGNVIYLPSLNYSGYDKMVIRACNSLLQNCLNDTIYITVNPNAQNDYLTTNGYANAVVASGNVIANDAGSGIQSSVSLFNNTGNGTLQLDANGNFVYRPNRNYCGLDSFQYQICDTNNLCAIATCMFEVFCKDVTVFTGFSPNGDGINDNWVLPDIEGTINTVRIFDRWGRLVNSYTNYDNVSIVWDGTNSAGNQLISGTYFYAIEIENKPRRLGWIEITR
jgi:gliding motility-associated-like protein